MAYPKCCNIENKITESLTGCKPVDLYEVLSCIKKNCNRIPQRQSTEQWVTLF